MAHIKKTPVDLLDDIYSLAYWMTGNESVSHELVSKTYLYANTKTQESELLKTLRKCYVDQFGQYTDFCTGGKPCKNHFQLIDSLRQWAADIKLSVLLSEISGLKHRQISAIVGKPVETVRLWLYCGRKLLANDGLLQASA